MAELVIRVNNLLNYINENCVGKRVLVIGHGSVSWALVILLKLLSDPAKDDYKIKYGELEKLY